MVLPEARIGEDALFIVKENDMKGHILLEMGKLTMSARQDNMLREALVNAGMPVSDEMLSLGRDMLTHNIPVDARSLQRAAFFRFTPHEAALPADGVIFLLNEEFPAERGLVNAFNKVYSRRRLLTKSLTQIIEAVSAAQPERRVALVKTLLPDCTGDNTAHEAKLALEKKLFLNLNGSKPAPDDYYRELSETLNRLRERLKNETGALTDAVGDALDTLRVMGLIRKRRMLYQLPFITKQEGPACHAELTVFKNPDASRSYGALGAVDTLTLRRTEFYIQKANGRLSLTFRCESDRVLNLLNSNLPKLTQALKNIPIGNITFDKPAEPFTFTSPEPYAEAPVQESVKRFTFDMRV
jgi:hypothetical protein